MERPTCFDFFKLLQELRDLVYHFLWVGPPDLVVPYLGRKSLLRYGGTNRTHAKAVDVLSNRMNVLPSWLFINKTFYRESMALLNKRSEWVRLPYGDYHPNAGSTTLFGPISAQTVTLIFKEYGRSNTLPFRVTVESHKVQHDIVSHNRIAEDMSASGKPQYLHLWIQLEEEAAPKWFEAFVDMNFNFLEPFQHVEMTTLAICAYDGAGTYTRPVTPERLKKLQIGMQKIAGKIFDGCEPEAKDEKHGEDAETQTMHHWYRFTRV